MDSVTQHVAVTDPSHTPSMLHPVTKSSFSYRLTPSTFSCFPEFPWLQAGQTKAAAECVGHPAFLLPHVDAG